MPRTSPVWSKFYDHPKSVGISVCKICKANVQRGGRSGTHTNTTNLFSHLASKHRVVYDHLKGQRINRSLNCPSESCPEQIGTSASSSSVGVDEHNLNEDNDVIQTSPPLIVKRPSTVQSKLRLSNSFTSQSSLQGIDFSAASSKNSESDSTTSKNLLTPSPSNISHKIYDFFRPKSLRSTSLTSMRINVDISRLLIEQLLPFSIVDSNSFRTLINNLEPGYQVPSRMYFCRIMLPFLQKELFDGLRNELRDVKSCSLTTDCWTAKSSPDVALMSFTCHWVNEKDMSLQHAVLAAKPLKSRHTAPNLKVEILSIMNKWGLEGKVNAIISDNAANLVAAIEDIPGVTHIPCASHTLQLVVMNEVLRDISLNEIITQAKKIVTYYKHSTKATISFQNSQSAINAPSHRLIQDVPTRWNSTFLMLNRLYEQREAIIDHLTKEKINAKGEAAKQIQNIITAYINLNWEDVDKFIELLKPFYEMTMKLNKDRSILSEIIPLSYGTRSQLADQSCSGMETTQEAYLASLNQRFDEYENIQFCTFATTLDPRYKLHIFQEEKRNAIREALKKMMSEHISSSTADQASELSKSAQSEASKRARSSLDFALRRVLKRVDDKPAGVAETNELDEYLRIEPIDLDADPFDWWRINATSFPRVAKLAMQYLHAPSTSVASERLFSIAGRAYTPLRNRLKGNHAEMLLVLNANRERGM